VLGAGVIAAGSGGVIAAGGVIIIVGAGATAGLVSGMFGRYAG
jgi:hypothetical protein